MKRIASGKVPQLKVSATDHAFLQGVSARARRTRSASAARARRIVSPPAAMISVLKTSWLIPMKIGLPEPFRDDEGSDRGDRDRRDGRDPEAGHDRRRGERQLDADERLQRASGPCRAPPRGPRPEPRGAPRGCSGRGSAACS